MCVAHLSILRLYAVLTRFSGLYRVAQEFIPGNSLSLDLVGENAQLVLFYEPKDRAARSGIESPRDLYTGSMLEMLCSDQEIRVDVQLNH